MTRAVLAFLLVALAVCLAPSSEAADPSRRAGTETSGFDTAGVELVTPSEGRLEEFLGRRIVGVSIETSGRRWSSRPALRTSLVGKPLSADLARSALHELLDTGEFAQAFADARPREDGVVLRLVVVPRRLVAQLVVDAGGVSESRVQSALALSPGAEVTEGILRAARSRVLDLYRKLGFPAARVTITTSDTDAPMEVIVRVVVVTGSPRRIARRVFELAPASTEVVGALRERYRVSTGDVASEEDLRDADANLADLLHRNGFLEAEVGHRVVMRGSSAFLFVELAAGPLYRFEFERARAFDGSELRAALALDRAADASVPALTDRLVAFYRKRGYLDAWVAPRVVASPDGAVRTVVFAVHEGSPTRVARRRFTCLPEDAPEGLRPSDLDDELDAILEEELPGRTFLSAIDEAVADAALAPGGGTRAPPRRAEPARTFEAEAYQKALEHLAELVKSRGFLNAVVGPVSVVRARCRVGRGPVCEPEPLPDLPAPACALDAFDLPVPEPPLPEGTSCVPDPSRGVTCASDVVVTIPVHLGARTRLYDVAFEGNTQRTSKALLRTSQLVLGAPLSQLEIEAARARIQNGYADEGFVYAAVRVDVDYSPDRTRARVRFGIVEHQPVEIAGYDVQGATRTDRRLILSRLALCQDLPRCTLEERYFRRGAVRESEQRIAALGVFSSVSIALVDADVPERKKRVLISVVEQPSQYLEPRLGFSTGEGMRFAFEYGHRNVASKAIGLTVRVELGYLPDFLILDSGVRRNFETFLPDVAARLERRNAVSLRFPDVGLGPNVILNVDGVDVRDNQRDFSLGREALLPLLTYRPSRTLTLQLGASAEVNEISVYRAGGIEAIIANNPGLATLLRVPEGRTVALSQRVQATWDRRDNAFAATRGTLVVAGVEHVTALPLDDATSIDSEFLRVTARTAGYVRLSARGLALALSLAGGGNVQLKETSQTYPDRLFFLGGVNTLRGFGLDALVPEDLAEEVLAGRLGLEAIGVRAGNLYVNPRAELRVPVTDTFALGLFVDAGNVWSKTDSIQTATDLLTLRYATGAGLRATTPVGPVAFDGGFNLAPRAWESVGALHFSIGLF